MLDNIIPLSPVNFFAIQYDCHFLENGKDLAKENRLLLPDLGFLTGEETFAHLSMGWNEKGLYFFAQIKRPLLKVTFPEIEAGDSLELFIDTRDVKTSGHNTRFCHHFYFLPEKVIQEDEEIPQAAEVTRFRGEDAHELCDPNTLIISTTTKRTSYSMNIFIPAECLHGYDPSQFKRLGFNYRFNRYEGDPQCFSSCSSDFSIEQQPSLWASFKLLEK